MSYNLKIFFNFLIILYCQNIKNVSIYIYNCFNYILHNKEISLICLSIEAIEKHKKGFSLNILDYFIQILNNYYINTCNNSNLINKTSAIEMLKQRKIENFTVKSSNNCKDFIILYYLLFYTNYSTKINIFEGYYHIPNCYIYINLLEQYFILNTEELKHLYYDTVLQENCIHKNQFEINIAYNDKKCTPLEILLSMPYSLGYLKKTRILNIDMDKFSVSDAYMESNCKSIYPYYEHLLNLFKKLTIIEKLWINDRSYSENSFTIKICNYLSKFKSLTHFSNLINHITKKQFIYFLKISSNLTNLKYFEI